MEEAKLGYASWTDWASRPQINPVPIKLLAVGEFS
jgi:hypothetical protein